MAVHQDAWVHQDKALPTTSTTDENGVIKAKRPGKRRIYIAVGACVGLVILSVGLGVGLGLGLSKDSSDSSDSSASSVSSGASSPFSPPTPPPTPPPSPPTAAIGSDLAAGATYSLPVSSQGSLLRLLRITALTSIAVARSYEYAAPSPRGATALWRL